MIRIALVTLLLLAALTYVGRVLAEDLPLPRAAVTQGEAEARCARSADDQRLYEAVVPGGGPAFTFEAGLERDVGLGVGLSLVALERDQIVVAPSGDLPGDSGRQASASRLTMIASGDHPLPQGQKPRRRLPRGSCGDRGRRAGLAAQLVRRPSASSTELLCKAAARGEGKNAKSLHPLAQQLP